MAQPADSVASLLLNNDLDAIKKEDIGGAVVAQPLASAASLPHPGLIQAFIPFAGHPHQSFVPYPTQNVRNAFAIYDHLNFPN